MKKLTIIGRGTVGCLAIAHFLRWTDWEIDWIFDPSVEPAPVGEGTTLAMPRSLYANLNFDSNDMDNVFATPKLGIWKRGWGEGKEYKHTFPAGTNGIHFNALLLQQYVFEKIIKNPRVTCIESNVVNHENLDSDFVMVCTGTPASLDQDYHIHNNIPVNSCMIFQCPWELPKFNYSLTFARQYGWLFGIPLKNRCAIGYVFNDSFADNDTIEQEAREILNEFNLTPNITRQLKFKNYSKRQNFTERVAYNGNASYFLEPLEATSTGFADKIIRLSYDMWKNGANVDQLNSIYNREISDIESMICLHYFSGSMYNNSFWDYSKKLGEEKVMQSLTNRTPFFNSINTVLNYKSEYINDSENFDSGSWSLRSYRQNINELGIRDKLVGIINSLAH